MTHKDNTEDRSGFISKFEKSSVFILYQVERGSKQRESLGFNFSDPSQKGPKAVLVF